MKKASLYIAIIGVLLAGANVSYAAGVAGPDSSVSNSGTGFALDFGVPDYPGSLYTGFGAGQDLTSTILISTSTPYTILAYFIGDPSPFDINTDADILCNSVSILPFTEDSDYAQYLFSQSGVFNSYAPVHCSGNLTVQDPASYETVAVQYVPYDTRLSSDGSATSTQSATLVDIAFGLALIITLLFLMVCGFMYNNITSKKPWY